MLGWKLQAKFPTGWWLGNPAILNSSRDFRQLLFYFRGLAAFSLYDFQFLKGCALNFPSSRYVLLSPSLETLTGSTNPEKKNK
jgi:hypothetical protein